MTRWSSPRPRISLNTVEAAIDAAVAGLGVTRLLSYQVVDELRSGALVPVLEDFAPGPIPVQLVYAGQGAVAGQGPGVPRLGGAAAAGQADGAGGTLGPVPALFQHAFPGQRVLHDRVEIIERRLPVERGEDRPVVGDEFGRITRAAAFEAALDLHVGDAVDGVEHLLDREAAAIACIEEMVAGRLGDQQVERGDVRGGKIADMDIVAHAGAVGRGEIGAID